MNMQFILLAAVLSVVFSASPSLSNDGNAQFSKNGYDETGLAQRLDGRAGTIAAVRQNGKWGYINGAGGIIIPIMYDDAGPFLSTRERGRRRNIARVRLGNKWGYINDAGEVIIPIIYDHAGPFLFGRDGTVHAMVRLNGRSFLIDSAGNEKRPFVLCEIKSITGFWADGQWKEAKKVRCRSGWGFAVGKEGIIPAPKRLGTKRNGMDLDDEDRIIIPAVYDYAADFSTLIVNGKKINRALVGLKGKYGFIDETGERVIPIRYDSLDMLRTIGPPGAEQGIARASIKGTYGYINEKGETMIPFLYENAQSFYHEKDIVVKESAAVKRGGKWGFIDYRGKETIPIIYDRIDSFQLIEIAGRERFVAMVMRNGMRGFIDNTGKIIVPLEYEKAFPYQTLTVSGRRVAVSRVRRAGKWGFIDAKGKIIIPLIYEDADRFNRRGRYNIARVKSGGEWIYIDDSNNQIDHTADFRNKPATAVTRGRDRKTVAGSRAGPAVSNGTGNREDPCAFPKRPRDHYVFADGAAVRAAPEASSGIIAKLSAGGRIRVLSPTGKSAAFGGATDRWYRVEHRGKTGFMWGGDIADSRFTVPVDGKKRLFLIRNRTNGTDRCSNPTFEMKMLLDGKVLSEYSGHPFDKVTAGVKSMEYIPMEGFSAPLNLLRVRFAYTGYRDKYNRSGTGIVYFDIDDGKLNKVLHLTEEAAGAEEFKSAKFSTELVLPDNRERVDIISLRVFGSRGGRTDLLSEMQYRWDWDARTFSEMK